MNWSSFVFEKVVYLKKLCIGQVLYLKSLRFSFVRKGGGKVEKKNGDF